MHAADRRGVEARGDACAGHSNASRGGEPVGTSDSAAQGIGRTAPAMRNPGCGRRQRRRDGWNCPCLGTQRRACALAGAQGGKRPFRSHPRRLAPHGRNHAGCDGRGLATPARARAGVGCGYPARQRFGDRQPLRDGRRSGSLESGEKAAFDGCPACDPAFANEWNSRQRPLVGLLPGSPGMFGSGFLSTIGLQVTARNIGARARSVGRRDSVCIWPAPSGRQ